MLHLAISKVLTKPKKEEEKMNSINDDDVISGSDKIRHYIKKLI